MYVDILVYLFDIINEMHLLWQNGYGDFLWFRIPNRIYHGGGQRLRSRISSSRPSPVYLYRGRTY